MQNLDTFVFGVNWASVSQKLRILVIFKINSQLIPTGQDFLVLQDKGTDCPQLFRDKGTAVQAQNLTTGRNGTYGTFTACPVPRDRTGQQTKAKKRFCFAKAKFFQESNFVCSYFLAKEDESKKQIPYARHYNPLLIRNRS